MTNSRNKGAAGERELAAKLTELGMPCRRTCQHDGRFEADIEGIPGLHIECKRVEALRLWDSYEQACRDASADEVPVVMHRANCRPWVVIMELEDFAELWQHAHGWDDGSAWFGIRKGDK